MASEFPEPVEFEGFPDGFTITTWTNTADEINGARAEDSFGAYGLLESVGTRESDAVHYVMDLPTGISPDAMEMAVLLQQSLIDVAFLQQGISPERFFTVKLEPLDPESKPGSFNELHRTIFGLSPEDRFTFAWRGEYADWLTNVDQPGERAIGEVTYRPASAEVPALLHIISAGSDPVVDPVEFLKQVAATLSPEQAEESYPQVIEEGEGWSLRELDPSTVEDDDVLLSLKFDPETSQFTSPLQLVKLLYGALQAMQLADGRQFILRQMGAGSTDQEYLAGNHAEAPSVEDFLNDGTNFAGITTNGTLRLDWLTPVTHSETERDKSPGYAICLLHPGTVSIQLVTAREGSPVDGETVLRKVVELSID